MGTHSTGSWSDVLQHRVHTPRRRKERFIQNARKALSNAMTTMGKFDFSINGVDEIKAGIDGLQNALEECDAKA